MQIQALESACGEAVMEELHGIHEDYIYIFFIHLRYIYRAFHNVLRDYKHL